MGSLRSGCLNDFEQDELTKEDRLNKRKEECIAKKENISNYIKEEQLDNGDINDKNLGFTSTNSNHSKNDTQNNILKTSNSQVLISSVCQSFEIVFKSRLHSIFPSQPKFFLEIIENFLILKFLNFTLHIEIDTQNGSLPVLKENLFKKATNLLDILYSSYKEEILEEERKKNENYEMMEQNAQKNAKNAAMVASSNNYYVEKEKFEMLNNQEASKEHTLVGNPKEEAEDNNNNKSNNMSKHHLESLELSDSKENPTKLNLNNDITDKIDQDKISVDCNKFKGLTDINISDIDKNKNGTSSIQYETSGMCKRFDSCEVLELNRFNEFHCAFKDNKDLVKNCKAVKLNDFKIEESVSNADLATKPLHNRQNIETKEILKDNQSVADFHNIVVQRNSFSADSNKNQKNQADSNKQSITTDDSLNFEDIAEIKNIDYNTIEQEFNFIYLNSQLEDKSEDNSVDILNIDSIVGYTNSEGKKSNRRSNSENLQNMFINNNVTADNDLELIKSTSNYDLSQGKCNSLDNTSFVLPKKDSLYVIEHSNPVNLLSVKSTDIHSNKDYNLELRFDKRLNKVNQTQTFAPGTTLNCKIDRIVDLDKINVNSASSVSPCNADQKNTTEIVNNKSIGCSTQYHQSDDKSNRLIYQNKMENKKPNNELTQLQTGKIAENTEIKLLNKGSNVKSNSSLIVDKNDGKSHLYSPAKALMENHNNSNVEKSFSNQSNYLENFSFLEMTNRDAEDDYQIFNFENTVAGINLLQSSFSADVDLKYTSDNQKNAMFDKGSNIADIKGLENIILDRSFIKNCIDHNNICDNKDKYQRNMFQAESMLNSPIVSTIKNCKMIESRDEVVTTESHENIFKCIVNDSTMNHLTDKVDSKSVNYRTSHEKCNLDSNHRMQSENTAECGNKILCEIKQGHLSESRKETINLDVVYRDEIGNPTENEISKRAKIDDASAFIVKDIDERMPTKTDNNKLAKSNKAMVNEYVFDLESQERPQTPVFFDKDCPDYSVSVNKPTTNSRKELHSKNIVTTKESSFDDDIIINEPDHINDVDSFSTSVMFDNEIIASEKSSILESNNANAPYDHDSLTDASYAKKTIISLHGKPDGYIQSIRLICSHYKLEYPEYEIVRENDVYICTATFLDLNFVSSFFYDKISSKNDACAKVVSYLTDNWKTIVKNK